MNDVVMKEKEIISALLRNLNEIRDFLLGAKIEEDCNEKKSPNGLLEIMTENTFSLDRAYGLSQVIKESIFGGK